MRAFVGVPIPALDGLKDALHALRDAGADLKVVGEDQFHLTLQFLADVDESEAKALVDVVGRDPLPTPFHIAVRDVGAFPNWHKLNVVWAGIEDKEGGLAKLHAATDKAWVGLGHLGEGRPFKPHLTLARKRTDRHAEKARQAMTRFRGTDFGTVRVDRINLYQSTLSADGARYDVVEAVTL